LACRGRHDLLAVLFGAMPWWVVGRHLSFVCQGG